MRVCCWQSPYSADRNLEDRVTAASTMWPVAQVGERGGVCKYGVLLAEFVYICIYVSMMYSVFRYNHGILIYV